MSTIQQRRMSMARERVLSDLSVLEPRWKPGSSKPPKEISEYRSCVRHLGPMIRTNGLGQTVAFYLSRGTRHHALAAKTLSAWLCAEGQPYARQADLVAAITQSDSGPYLAATAEAVVFVPWLSMFVAALIPPSDDMTDIEE